VKTIHVGTIDDVIMAIYFLFVLSIGGPIRRQIETSNDFLLTRHAIPIWITGLAFLSANLGAQEVNWYGRQTSCETPSDCLTSKTRSWSRGR
jgi:solute:Na+ symporter, SSS family